MTRMSMPNGAFSEISSRSKAPTFRYRCKFSRGIYLSFGCSVQGVCYTIFLVSHIILLLIFQSSTYPEMVSTVVFEQRALPPPPPFFLPEPPHTPHTLSQVKMLRQVHGVSDSRAVEIGAHYPLPRDLVAALSDPAVPESERALLLARKMGGGSTQKKIALRIFQLFTQEDGDFVIT